MTKFERSIELDSARPDDNDHNPENYEDAVDEYIREEEEIKE